MPPTTSARSSVPSARELADAELIEKIRQVHAELRRHLRLAPGAQGARSTGAWVAAGAGCGG